MGLFHPDNRRQSPRHAQLWAAYEIAFTAVDFLAAGLFVIGSILFFWSQTATQATWMFLLGSICFALKPTIRLTRELHYLRLGRLQALAEKADDNL